MTPQIPQLVEFRCQRCKMVYSLNKIAALKATCSGCNHTVWQLHAEYGATQGLQSESAITTVGLNVIGLSLLATTGVGFTYGSPSTNADDQSKVSSVVDLYDVSKPELIPILDKTPQALLRIAQFIADKEAEVHRNRMAERGATNCRSCQIVFVPAANKPWTLVGACSKMCCARIYQVDSYAQIEGLVEETSAGASKELDQKKADSSIIRTQCLCGQEMKFPSMYRGTYRKCPNCSTKLLVP